MLGWERRYATAGQVAAGAGSCEFTPSGFGGAVQIAPGANLPDRPLTPETLAFLARVAALSGGPLVVTTGTNHSHYTVDGRVSDHADGHAADLGMTANGGSDDSPGGDRIMTACLTAAGVPTAPAGVDARRGGLYTLQHEGLRVQCIWKTDQSGNDHNHVHIGVRPPSHRYRERSDRRGRHVTFPRPARWTPTIAVAERVVDREAGGRGADVAVRPGVFAEPRVRGVWRP